MTHLNIGDAAPDVDLILEEDKKIKLSALKGEFVVLFFYPKDNTPGCTIEAKDFSRKKAEFDKEGARIFGISKDSLSSHRKFKEKQDLQIELASDEDCVICNSYGTLAEKSMFGRKYMGIVRTSFLIDKTGAIANIWSNVKVLGHADEVLNQIQNMQK